jgi:hypothetical protein
MSISTNADRFALVSLFSWTYDCLPAGAIKFVDLMRQIGLNNLGRVQDVTVGA